MNWQKYRLPVGGLVLAALTLVLILGLRERRSESSFDQGELPELRAPEREKITAFSVTGTGEETIRIEQVDGEWRVVEPLSAATDEGAVSSALDKLSGMTVVAVAATKAANQDRLEVTPEKGVRVQVFVGAETALDFWMGGYRAGNTLVRLEGHEETLSVRGSLRMSLKRELRDWRDKKIVDLRAERVLSATFVQGDTTLRFVRGADATWKQAEGEEAIEGFDANKVQGIVSALAQLRATDFAKPTVDAAAAGMGQPVATVTLGIGEPIQPKPAPAEPPHGKATESKATEGKATESKATEGKAEAAAEAAAGPVAEEASAASVEALETIVLLLGATAGDESQHYLNVEGRDVVYVVPTATAEKLKVSKESFGASAEAPKAPADPGPMGLGGPGAMPGMPGMPTMPPPH